ncbi:inovirus Gp2 family protein [Providencia rettgeri]|nr:inovirus Gp2 family protein [Providencia rettgeri]
MSKKREYNSLYQQQIQETINKALYQYPRIAVFRVDLHFPIICDNGDMPTCFPNTIQAISRFIASLKAKLEHDIKNKERQGKRVFPNKLRYTWVREIANAANEHYHCLLIFNKDAYYHLGNYDITIPSLRTMITTAWYSALNLDLDPLHNTGPLVHYPDNGRYCLNRQSSDFKTEYDKLIERANYLAKEYSKQYSSHYRSFSCSQD